MSGAVLRSLGDLAEIGLIDADRRAALEPVGARYAVGLTRTMADLIDPSDPDDPIARQFVPRPEEMETRPAERADPIGDGAHMPVEGIVHRYPDRVLLKAVHVCPVYCRFCFRREMVGPEGHGTLSRDALDAAFAYIAARPEIWEVILTGGDPMVLSPRRLGDLMTRLAQIDHVKVVRLHTRVPVVDPGHVDDALTTALRKAGKTVYVAIHANHPRELTAAAEAACGRLLAGGVALVSQTVLLRGVNDDVAVLAALMRRFVEMRVTPYYLHHPDLAPGTGHFRLTVAEGQALVAELRGRLSGLCQPTYVLDIPGGHGKADIGRAEIGADGDGGYVVTDYCGTGHAYRDA
jgi:lysine 2,3-aminomutase